MRGYCGVVLCGVKTPENVGHSLRACGVFGASFLGFTGNRYRPHQTDTMKHHRQIPLFHAKEPSDLIPYDCVPVAVEILDGSVSLVDYVHPERAVYFFGGEDQTLGKSVTDKCRDIVSIPSRACLNLSACVNVVLYDRLSKSLLTSENHSHIQ